MIEIRWKDDVFVKHQLQQRCLADDGEWGCGEEAVDVGLLSMLPLAVFFWSCFFFFFLIQQARFHVKQLSFEGCFEDLKD